MGQPEVAPVTPSGREANAERSGADRPSAVPSCGEPALCYMDLTEATQWARACHPAYAGRIRFPVRIPDPAGPVQNW
jgi:hypothetical protein